LTAGVLPEAVQNVGTSDDDAAQKTQATGWRQNDSHVSGLITTPADDDDDDDDDDVENHRHHHPSQVIGVQVVELDD